jgi:hypothetical protein
MGCRLEYLPWYSIAKGGNEGLLTVFRGRRFATFIIWASVIDQLSHINLKYPA